MHATREALNPNVFIAPGVADGTMCLELFTAECSSMGSSRLPPMRTQSHAIATQSATTCNTNTKNDCPYVSVSRMKKQRMLEILLNGVSTRRYKRVIPEMADTVGVSRSTVSRDTIEASAAALKQLLERRFDDVELLIIYIDGMHFGEQCVLAAVGVDIEGRKHVLALREGATENAAAAKDLLQHLVEHGIDPTRRRLFVIDGSKALRTAINAVFGAETPVQRCRNHKLRNVLGRLPREQQGQTSSLMRAAWKMNPKDGIAKFRQIAGWLEHDYPEAAAALLEGLEECFTINRLDVPRSLHRCLATSNILDSPHSGVRSRTRRVCRWRPGMPARWSAAAFLEGEKSFRKIMGFRDLWALKAILDGSQPATRQVLA